MSAIKSSKYPPCKVSDLAELNPPVTLDKLRADSEVSFIPMSDVSETGRWIVRQTRTFGEVRQGYTAFQEGDVLFAKITPCMENGKGCHAINLINGVGFGSTEFHVLRAKADSEARFIFHLTQFEELRLKAAAKMVGSAGQQRVPSSFFSEYDVIKPEPEEQTCIAAVLSSIDRAIEQTEALIAKQQRIKTGLMQDLLTKGIDEHGNIRSEATHEFKDSPLGRIPKDWETIQLGDVKQTITSGSRGWAKYYSSEGALFLRIGNLTREHINLRFDEIIHVQPPKSSEGIRTVLREDDILISITADLGIIGVIPPEFEEAYLNQHIALVRLNKSAIYPRWVAHFLSGYAGQFQFQALNESGAKAGLNLPTIASLKIARPETEREQKLISQIIDQADSNIEVTKQQIDKYRRLKAGLMQDLLTGKVSIESLLTEQTAAVS